MTGRLLVAVEARKRGIVSTSTMAGNLLRIVLTAVPNAITLALEYQRLALNKLTAGVVSFGPVNIAAVKQFVDSNSK